MASMGAPQLYDPFNSPNAQGNLHLGLPTGRGAYFGAAVISGSMAYFASGGLPAGIALLFSPFSQPGSLGLTIILSLARCVWGVQSRCGGKVMYRGIIKGF